MSSDNFVFNKENVDIYLKELGKAYRKINGKGTPAEIVLIGGASVLVNYGFRDITNDIDVLMHAASTMKEAINCVGDKYGLPNGWLNDDFKKTKSYTAKIYEFSKYYKTFYNVLTVRVISGEYLIAMKLMAGREYKKDKSDVIGILAEHEKNGNDITLDMIIKAVIDLYGDLEALPEESVSFIKKAFETGKFESQYNAIRNEEKETFKALLDFEQTNPDVVTKGNVNDIIKILQKKGNK